MTGTCQIAWDPASPRTRGSTLVLIHGKVGIAGFPAHAGIDLGLRSGDRGVIGLPRARGDRPMDFIGKKCIVRASPRTRGSTFWAEFKEE